MKGKKTNKTIKVDKLPCSETEKALAKALGKSPWMVRFYGYRLGIEIALRRALTKDEQANLASYIMREMR